VSSTTPAQRRTHQNPSPFTRSCHHDHNHRNRNRSLSSTHQKESVLNSAARLIYHMRSSDHITDALTPSLAARTRGSRIISPCCRTKSSTEVRPGTCDPSCLCQISPVDGRCALRIPVDFSYHPSSPRQSAAEPSRLPVPASGTPCRKKSRRYRHR